MRKILRITFAIPSELPRVWQLSVNASTKILCWGEYMGHPCVWISNDDKQRRSKRFFTFIEDGEEYNELQMTHVGQILLHGGITSYQVMEIP